MDFEFETSKIIFNDSELYYTYVAGFQLILDRSFINDEETITLPISGCSILSIGDTLILGKGRFTLYFFDFPTVFDYSKDRKYTYFKYVGEYEGDTGSLILTDDPNPADIVKEAIFSNRLGRYIAKECSVYSKFEKDYLYLSDTLFSNYLDSFIYSRNCARVFNYDTNSYDWVPEEYAIETDQGTFIKDQVKENKEK